MVNGEISEFFDMNVPDHVPLKSGVVCCAEATLDMASLLSSREEFIRSSATTTKGNKAKTGIRRVIIMAVVGCALPLM